MANVIGFIVPSGGGVYLGKFGNKILLEGEWLDFA